MTDETAPKPPRQAFSAALQGARVEPAAEAPAPAPEAAPAVPPASAPEAPAQLAAPAAPDAPPASFTGNETEEELQAAGAKSPATHERIRRLAQEKNEAAAKAAQLEQLQQQQARELEELRQKAELHQQVAPAPDITQFKEPFPEDGTPEEQELWQHRKLTWEKDTAPALRASQELVAKALAPLQQQGAQAMLEREWASLQPTLDRYGTSRAELEGSAMEMLMMNPSMGLRPAVHMAMDMRGVYDSHVPEAPPAQVPGSGNAPPVEPPPAPALPSDPGQAAIVQAREVLASNPNPSVAREAMRAILRANRG